MKYTTINIGPIISTLGMARKPRELWAASYMFSHLMKCIYGAAEEAKADIISPAKPTDENGKVGIYPDRIYMRNIDDVKALISNAMMKFWQDLTDVRDTIDLTYFNVMSATSEKDSESAAIADLNQKLDVLELCNFAADGQAAKTVYNLLSKTRNSHLFQLATGEDRFHIKSLEEIARTQLDADENAKERSHHRYICIVQADGDNVGKTVSHPGLEDNQVKNISKELVAFGQKAEELIAAFGGEPIYAGGDDLLFIAPVIGADGANIFNLLERIENDAFKGVHDVVERMQDKEGNALGIEASLSFGVSITYYKYPLYEALESARNLLFGKAKNIADKKAIAWSLRKHSGGTFDVAFSLKNKELKQQFANLIAATADGATVSAVAHKIRQEEALVDIVLQSGDTNRLDALFDKVLEFDSGKSDYFNAVKAIMPTLYKVIGKEQYAQTLYSLLRTAKFINGEDLRDE